MSLGIYTLDPASTIMLTDEADGYVIADAIKLVGETAAGLAAVTGGTYYVHTDHLGTPQKLTDKAQTVVWDAVYQPFGQVTIPTKLVAYNQRFPGQYFDSETGLHYNYFRDYDATLGRYIESDPIGLAGGVNTYSYVRSNPLSATDPLGLWSFSIDYYQGIGGGITIGRDDITGEWFGGGRLGLGVGGGLSFEPLENGPANRELKPDPYSDICPSLKAGSSGTSVGTYATLGASVGPYEISYGTEGGRYFDSSGGSYSEGPGISSPTFNGLGGSGVSFGGAIGVDVIGW